MLGYFYDNEGFIHYYYTLDDLLIEGGAALGDDYSRALKSEMEDEIQRRIDDYELARQYDDEEDE